MKKQKFKKIKIETDVEKAKKKSIILQNFP